MVDAIIRSRARRADRMAQREREEEEVQARITAYCLALPANQQWLQGSGTERRQRGENLNFQSCDEEIDDVLATNKVSTKLQG